MSGQPLSPEDQSLPRYPRLYGGFGIVWNVSIVGYLMLQDAPWAWKIAWGEYGTIAVIYFTGLLRGWHRNPIWRRRISQATVIGFVLAGALFVLGFVFQPYELTP